MGERGKSVGYIRESYMMPRDVRRSLDGRFPAEIILEVFYAVDDYAYYWDEHRSGEGFDFSYLSPPAQVAFAMVLDVIDEYNAGYYRKSDAQRNNAQIGVERRQEAKRRSKRQAAYYENNREEINRRRREKYEEEKSFRMTQKRKTKNDCNSAGGVVRQGVEQDFSGYEECHTKNKNVIRNVKRKMSCESVQSQSGQAFGAEAACITKRHAKNENVKRKTSCERPQSLCGKEFAENSAMAHRIIGYCNSSLRSELPGYGKGGVGENQVMHNAPVDNPAAGQFPTSGLSGSKAVQTGRTVPVCSKAVDGHPAAARVTPQGEESQRNTAVGENGSKAVSGGILPPPSSARMDYAAGSKLKPPLKPWLSAPHEPGADEVKITQNFKIDFTDPIFKPYAAADTTLRVGLENWLKKKKMGCSVEKKWLCRQIVAFARNQGKLWVLMGVDPPD